MNKKYADIRSMAELDAAIAANRRRQQRKGREVSRRLSFLQEAYAPPALLREGVRSAAVSLIGPELLLRTIRRAKRLLR